MNQLDIVKTIYAAFARGDVPAILEHLSEDVEWEHHGVDHGVPWLRPGRGVGHARTFFEALRALRITRFEPTSFLEGPGQVAVVIEIELEVVATGKRVRDLELHLWSFDSEGRVTRFKHLVDTHQHVLAAQA